jgi:hypothetical protein
MAINTYGIQLMQGTKGTGTAVTYTKLVDIKDFPDLGGAPEMLETTTLSDAMQTYIEGIQSSDALEFTANYSKEDYTKLTATTIKGQKVPYAVYFGADGADGKFEFEGYLSVRVNGGGVNEVVGMTISIAPASAITVS